MHRSAPAPARSLPMTAVSPRLRGRFTSAAPVLFSVLALWGPPAGASTQAGAADWTVSHDGTYVIDVRAQLAWPRCVEGMRWTGTTCTGQPLLLDRAEAAALATARWKAEDMEWRLPRAAELQRLFNKSAVPPGLDRKLFPAAPDLWHWTSTVNAGPLRSSNPYNYNTIRQDRSGDGAAQMAQLNGWAVSLNTGEARGDVARGSKLPVRLVRTHLGTAHPNATNSPRAK